MLQPALDATPVRSDAPEFSLVRGGPLYQLFRRAHLSGDSWVLLSRRVLVVALLAWLPLLVLAVVDDDALGGTLQIPFLHDVEAHVRFLVSVPLLVIAEVIVDERISPLVRRFVDQRIIRADDMAEFNAAVTSAMRARDSAVLEGTSVLLVYTLGLLLWRSAIAPNAATWFARPDETGLHLSTAGYWYMLVSIPLFQFILLRWYLRFAIWFRLLWQVSKLNLHLVAAHPDGAGGIAFLGNTAYAFSPVLFAQGALLSGVIATRILYEGKTVAAFEMDAVGWISAMVIFVLGPLVMFTPHLERAWRQGSAEYGGLASEYIHKFEKRWIPGGLHRTGALLGAPDIQSLADLGTSHQVVDAIRVVPFGKGDVLGLVVAAAAPFLPLALTMFSAKELLTRLLKLFFA